MEAPHYCGVSLQTLKLWLVKVWVVLDIVTLYDGVGV